MNDMSSTYPWVDYILRLWLKDEISSEGDINAYTVAQNVNAIKKDGGHWQVDSEWFAEKIANDKEIRKIISPSDFAFLIMGVGELMARTTPYELHDIVTYVSTSPAVKTISECLRFMGDMAVSVCPSPLDIPLVSEGALQFINTATLCPHDFNSVGKLFERWLYYPIYSHCYGLVSGLKILLCIDGEAVGRWLREQEHPFVLDAVLNALNDSFLMTFSSGNKKEIVQLICSQHPFIMLTGMQIIHSSASQDRNYTWSLPLNEAFKILEDANIPRATSVWAALFRLKVLSRAFTRNVSAHEDFKRRYACSIEDPKPRYENSIFLKKEMERAQAQSNQAWTSASECIREIVLHWPENGFSDGTLRDCAYFISLDEPWVGFVKAIHVLKDKEYFIDALLNKFIGSSELLSHEENTHCFATDAVLQNANLIAKVFLLKKHSNIGKSFGKLFFSDLKGEESLKIDDDILAEPYSMRVEFTRYHHALNGLGIANYIAIKIGNEGKKYNYKGADYLIQKGVPGLIKVIAAAQGKWNVAEQALQTFSMTALGALTNHERLFSDDDIERFLDLPHLRYSLRAMLGLSRQTLFKKYQEHVLLLLEQSLWPSVVKADQYDSISLAFLAYDYALMRLAQFGAPEQACCIVEMWEKSIKTHSYPIPKVLDGALRKINKALFGDKECCNWLIDNPNLSTIWSASFLQEKIRGRQLD